MIHQIMNHILPFPNSPLYQVILANQVLTNSSHPRNGVIKSFFVSSSIFFLNFSLPLSSKKQKACPLGKSNVSQATTVYFTVIHSLSNPNVPSPFKMHAKRNKVYLYNAPKENENAKIVLIYNSNTTKAPKLSSPLKIKKNITKTLTTI